MVASNRKAAKTSLGFLPVPRGRNRDCFTAGSSSWEDRPTSNEPVAGILEGDLSGIAAVQLSPLLRPYTFPPLELALETDWDRKLAQLAARSVAEPITMVSGVPGWLLLLFQRILELTGKTLDRRGLASSSSWSSTAGVKFDPYRESFQRILGSPAIRPSGSLSVLRGFHRLRRSGDRAAPPGLRSRDLLRVRPGRRARARPVRLATGWGRSEPGSTTRSSCRLALACGPT